ncbi:DUF4339 domain-containing protein [Chromobacterium sp. ASV23]|uniref:DUF4339 domain-containing protein n=1 Tax=Chromobacterium sp. ASV23 TaxID=2795110 RepID=UPI0018ED3D1C|nr:DUF4339 domain-containing protein [Chromobacterium sp. ASV23]
MTEWHYEDAGERHGPVSLEEMEALIHQQSLQADSLVWSPGLPTWTALSHTELASHLNGLMPPPLPTDKIDDIAVRCLCVAPVLGFILESMAAGAMDIDFDTFLRENLFWYLTPILNIGLCGLDIYHLKQAGIQTHRFGKFLVLIPLYLWKRAKTLNSSQACFWIWLACFGIVQLAHMS